jgi:hypothetical protein
LRWCLCSPALLWPLLWLPACCAGGESAWDPPPVADRSSLSLEFTTDDDGGWSRQLAASLASPLALQFNLLYGVSTVSSSAGELNPDFWSLGFASDPLNSLSLDFSYDYWGTDDDLTIEGLRLSISYNAEDFSLSLIPQQRSVRFYLRDWVRPYLAYVDVDSEDIGIAFSYYGLTDWILSAEYFHYRYAADLTVLAEDFRALLIFPLTTLELASGLYSHHVSVSATRLHALGEIGCQWFHATSAVDGSHADVAALYTSVELSPEWMLRLQGGMQQVDYADDSVLFFGMGLERLW